MSVAFGRRLLLGSALVSTLGAPWIRTARADPIRMRVSLDTSSAHGRTLSMADFLKKLEAASQGEIAPVLSDRGQLFPDSAVIKGLVLGQVEMAAPGTWLVSAYVPEADLAQLPVFYGQPVETTHRAIDGVPGDMVNTQISKKLRVTIPGRWLDLGFTNWYSARKPLSGFTDLKGLRIRNSGGFAQPWRARFFGGVPDVTTWPEVPLALSQGTFDVLQTTSESCVSASLWDAGLRFGLIDHQSMGNYIPMLSEAFWGALRPALRTLVTDLWAANIGTYRSNLVAAQDRAEKELRTRGVRLVLVPPEALAEQRRLMMQDQDKVAKAMKISPEVLGRISDALADSN
jgi:TRAP-type C4-dicarboxylate transport system substrate-binding protein